MNNKTIALLDKKKWVEIFLGWYRNEIILKLSFRGKEPRARLLLERNKCHFSFELGKLVQLRDIRERIDVKFIMNRN